MPSGIYKRTKEMRTGKHMIGREFKNSGQFKKGIYVGFGFKKRHKPWNKDRPWSKEVINRIKLKKSGKKHTKEHNKKIAKNNAQYWLGKKRPQMSGSLNSNWQGGISFEPYSVDWTQDLKKAIRKRDKYTCRICRKEPALDCHHIDYDKKNCNPKNLITLCRRCHTKTNGNRNFWINYFNN